MRRLMMLSMFAVIAAPAFAARDLEEGPALSDLLDQKPKPRFNLDPQELANEDAARQKDPLKYLTGDMSDVTGELSQLRTGKPVQDKQGQIVSRLDELIEMLEKQSQSSGSGSGSASANPSSPMKDSKIAGGPGGIGDLHAPKDGKKEWVRLPPKERDAILQSRTEGFPPGFEDLLRSYYLRLAEERVAKDEVAATQPANP